MNAKTVLLLEDDGVFRTALADALDALGVLVLQARTGAEASRLLLDAEPDLVMVDGLLPDIDGISWTAAFRQNHPETPVAFVSSFWGDRRSYDRLNTELGVAFVARKPVAPLELAKRLCAVIGVHAAPEWAVPAPAVEPRPAPMSSWATDASRYEDRVRAARGLARWSGEADEELSPWSPAVIARA